MIAALLHPEGTHHVGELASRWTFEPLAAAGLALMAFLYAAGLRNLWRSAGSGRGVKVWQALAFAAGWTTLALAVLSPVHALSGVLLSVHMAQHELLMLVAAPLVVLGVPLSVFLWAFGQEERVRIGRVVAAPAVRRAWTALTGPMVVFALHAAAIWVWHVPVLYEAALRSEAVHTLQHVAFFVTATLFWFSVVAGRYGRVGYGASVLYVFLTALHTSVLGALLTLAPSLVYPLYGTRDATWGVDPLEHQQLAGLVMWIPAGALLACVALALFAAWLGETERRAVLIAAPPPGGAGREP
jgi:putative membrane protein